MYTGFHSAMGGGGSSVYTGFHSAMGGSSEYTGFHSAMGGGSSVYTGFHSAMGGGGGKRGFCCFTKEVCFIASCRNILCVCKSV